MKVIINIKKFLNKKINNIETQCIKDMNNNGFIEVEQSKVNKNLFHYYKKLKNNKKSTRSISFTRDEIIIIDNYIAINEKAKSL